MEDKSREIQVGIVSILAALILILGLSLGNNLSISSDLKIIKIKFPHSGGLRTGDPVMVNGVERGRVDNISNGQNSVLIDVSLEEIEDLKTDLSARIMMFEITGGRKIEINPGISPQQFNPNDIAIGKTSADMSDLIATVGDIALDAGSLIKRIDTLSAMFQKTFNDDFINDLKNTASNANELITNTNDIVVSEKDNIKQSIREVRSLITKLNDAVDKNEPQVSELISNLDNTMSKVDSFLDNSNKTINDVNKIVEDFSSIMENLKGNESTIGVLLNDKEFVAKFDKAIVSIGELLSQIQEHGINVNARLGTRPKEED